MEETKSNEVEVQFKEQTKTNLDQQMIAKELDKIQQEFDRAVDGLLFFAQKVTAIKEQFIETKKRLEDEN